MTWLVFFDDLHLNFMNTGHLRTLLRSMASELVRDEDAVVLRSSGPSPSIGLTTDRALVDAAIGRVAGNALPPSAILRSPGEIDEEVRSRASLAIAAAIETLNADRSPPRRREAMLYVSNGYQLDPSDRQVAGFAGVAQRSNVTVFALNARALPGAAAVPVQGDAARWASYLTATVNSLRAISEPTGGFAVLEERDFVDALQRIGRRMR